MNLACRFLKKTIFASTGVLLLFTFKISELVADPLPDACVQLPQRTDACPNIVYKRSPIDVAQTNTKKGQMICICMADFSSLRIEAESEMGKVDQLIELSKLSVVLSLTEDELLQLIRK